LSSGIQPGPLANFPKWKELGPFVKKGAKALTLCVPLTCKRKKAVANGDGTEQEEEQPGDVFSLREFQFQILAFSSADEGTEQA
jgi:hypothetical protein